MTDPVTATHLPDRVDIIYGKRGQGKSVLLRRLQLTHPRPAVVIDVLWELTRRPQDVLLRPKSRGALWDVVELACQWSAKVRDRVLVIDECDAVIRPGGLMPPALSDAMSYGRHFGLDLILAVRRPPDLPLKIAAQASDLWVFAQDVPRDRAYFRALGIDPALFEVLPEHAFIHKRASKLAHVHSCPWTACEGS